MLELIEKDLAVITLTTNENTDDGKTAISEVLGMLDSGDKTSVILDFRGMVVSPRTAECLAFGHWLDPTRIKCMAILIDRKVLLGVFRATQMAADSQIKFDIFTTRADAEVWIRTVLEDE